jgi:tetratricopeptide (TPR) repeat protein
VSGLRYYTPPGNWVLTGLDGKVQLHPEGMVIPLLDEDFQALNGELPSYDCVGRGIYYLLRANPDCTNGKRYAEMLRDGYPHLLSEMATHIVMLDKKDVDVTYLERKINYLKIFALIEPENFRFPFEIGKLYADRGLQLSALQAVTLNLYRAEEFLRKAHFLAPEDTAVRYELGEVCYMLGKYDDARSLLSAVVPSLEAGYADMLECRLAAIEAGSLPRVPAVDYLEAIAAGFVLHQQGDYEETAAILMDVLDDEVFCAQFPLPELPYILGQCSTALGMPRRAEDYFREALRINPSFADAQSALAEITG